MTSEVKKRFVKDESLPIQLLKEPYFSYYICLYNRDFDTVRKYGDLHRALERCGSEEKFLQEYYSIRDKVITCTKELPEYAEFLECDMSKYDIEAPVLPNAHKTDVYKMVNVDRRGVAQSYGGISLALKDLAKIGRLYLHGGVWNGRRIVSEEWIRQSTAYDTSNEGYHFNWYNLSYVGEPKPEHPGFYALGIKMQVLYANPDLNLIMVRIGNGSNGSIFHPLLFETLANKWLIRGDKVSY